MRELKFRYIWQHEETGRILSKVYTLDEIENWKIYDDMSDNPFYKRYVFVDKSQYTGLKDRNGKEIYEGDIVSSKYIIEPGAIVTYSDRYASFSIGPDWPVGEYYVYANGWLDVQVVGNVHENPELVKT